MSKELENIKGWLEGMSTDDLNAIKKSIDLIQKNRIEQRKKEMWGNVVAALRKYTEEVDNIEAEGGFGEGVICIDNLDNPGLVYIAY